MSISKRLLLHIARLARLELDDAAVESMTRDLSAILEYVERMRAADAGASDTAPVGEEGTPLRSDTVCPGLSPDAALANAPSTEEGMFQVPPAIEDRA